MVLEGISRKRCTSSKKPFGVDICYESTGLKYNFHFSELLEIPQGKSKECTFIRLTLAAIWLSKFPSLSTNATYSPMIKSDVEQLDLTSLSNIA